MVVGEGKDRKRGKKGGEIKYYLFVGNISI